MKPLSEWDDEDVIQFRIRADGFLRKMFLGTWAVCLYAVIWMYVFQLTSWLLN